MPGREAIVFFSVAERVETFYRMYRSPFPPFCCIQAQLEDQLSYLPKGLEVVLLFYLVGNAELPVQPSH